MRRWLLWTFGCGRGRYCAHLVLTDATLSNIPEVKATAEITYTCGACGTHYRSDVVFGDSGWVQGDRERVKI